VSVLLAESELGQELNTEQREFQITQGSKTLGAAPENIMEYKWLITVLYTASAACGARAADLMPISAPPIGTVERCWTRRRHRWGNSTNACGSVSRNSSNDLAAI
jgi:hypothetical protein